MLSQRVIDSFVGLFILFALIAFCVLALKVSGLTNLFPGQYYHVTADFDDIGGLKVRAPVKIGGVQIGEVSNISLNKNNFKATVDLQILSKFKDIPDDSSAGIFTAGLLGDNYISITPMYSEHYLNDGSKIEITHSAIVLEKLIGQFLYKVGGNNSDNAVKTEVKN